MKEKFRDKRFNKSINVTLTNGERWQADTFWVLGKIIDLIDEYSAQDITLTLRQLYYQLVATSVIPNDNKAYGKLSKLVTDARYAGLIDWYAIEDRGRVPSFRAEWDNISELMESALSSYRLPRWTDQEYYVELFSEKDALSSVLMPIARRWHITYCFNKGYGSASAMYRLYDRIVSKLSVGQKVVILYLGDHDPSGLDMVRDIKERISEFLGREGVDNDILDGSNVDNFEVISVALTMEQIEEYSPPPNPTKITDPRAKWYIIKHGEKCWEVDALKPNIMMEIVESASKDYIDIDKYDAWIEKEEEDKRQLRELAKEVK